MSRQALSLCWRHTSRHLRYSLHTASPSTLLVPASVCQCRLLQSNCQSTRHLCNNSTPHSAAGVTDENEVKDVDKPGAPRKKHGSIIENKENALVNDAESLKKSENPVNNNEYALVCTGNFSLQENTRANKKSLMIPKVEIVEAATLEKSKPLPDNVILENGKYFYKGIYLKYLNALTRRRDQDYIEVPDDDEMFLDYFNYDLTRAKAMKRQPKVDMRRLPLLKKDFFVPTPELEERSAAENEKYLAENNIIVSGQDLPPAIQQFSEYDFGEKISARLQQYDAPTAIQAQGWSIALQGRDLIGVGESGSGKTLAFLLPALFHVSHQQRLLQEAGVMLKRAALGLILVPTSDIARQILKVACQYGPSMGVHPVDITGGSKPQRQLAELRTSNLVIGTPGRVLNLVQRGDLVLDLCSYLVLDEADRMMDMSFEPQIRAIINTTRSDRQTLMWSATWPDQIQDLAYDFLSNPVRLCVGSTQVRANQNITQHVHITTHQEKTILLNSVLKRVMEEQPEGKVLVFAQTLDTVLRLTKLLRRRDVAVDCLHGVKSQEDREFTLKCFRQGYFSVLVATEVAARGLDIPDLTCVINYDYPDNKVDYIHCIGRTGRAGKRGVAHTFITNADQHKAQGLIEVLRENGQRVDTGLLHLAAKTKAGDLCPVPFIPIVDRFGKKVKAHETVEGQLGAWSRELSQSNSEAHKMFCMAHHARLKKTTASVKGRVRRIMINYTRSKKKKENLALIACHVKHQWRYDGKQPNK